MERLMQRVGLAQKAIGKLMRQKFSRCWQIPLLSAIGRK